MAVPEDLHSKYQGNSIKPREPEEPKPAKKVERIIEGTVVQRKKTLGRKITETFTGDDMHTVWSYVLLEVFVPALKTMISDAASQGVERLLFGDSRPRASSRVSFNRSSSYTPYNNVQSRRDDPRKPAPSRTRSSDPSEIILRTRGEAEDVISGLIMILQQYDVATVSDMYDLVGITGSFTDDKWGWYDLRDARVVKVREGYLVSLPKTSPIE